MDEREAWLSDLDAKLAPQEAEQSRRARRRLRLKIERLFAGFDETMGHEEEEDAE